MHASCAGLAHARLPSCPDWTVADLLWHLTEVHDFWRTVVAEQLSDLDGPTTNRRAPPTRRSPRLYRRAGSNC